jgi:hypothetical protein
MNFKAFNEIEFPQELRGLGFKDASYGNDETARADIICPEDDDIIITVWCYSKDDVGYRYVLCTSDEEGYGVDVMKSNEISEIIKEIFRISKGIRGNK